MPQASPARGLSHSTVARERARELRLADAGGPVDQQRVRQALAVGEQARERVAVPGIGRDHGKARANA